jgi:hypothetical protein
VQSDLWARGRPRNYPTRKWASTPACSGGLRDLARWALRARPLSSSQAPHPPVATLAAGRRAFLAEIDGNLTNWKREDGLIELHHTTKFRGPGFEPILFKLEKITTTKLKDTKGRLLPTVRAVPVGKVEEKSREDESRSDEDRLLIALLHNANRSWAELARAMKWTMGNRTPLSD